MYRDLAPRPARFSDDKSKEREGDAVADGEIQQYRNNRAGSVTVVLNVVDGWSFIS